MRITTSAFLAAACLAAACFAGALTPSLAQTPGPTAMAPLAQYLMPRADEVALARSAAPASISAGARVLVLGRGGYVEAAKGGNGFVCLVKRSWGAPVRNPTFWQPAIRGPICYNAAAAASVLPIYLFRTRLALAGNSAEAIGRALVAARARHELPSPSWGAMCYMMSKQEYVRGSSPQWHPHLMFFAPGAAARQWGANLPGSPLGADDYPESGMTIFVLTVPRWSDGTPDARANDAG